MFNVMYICLCIYMYIYFFLCFVYVFEVCFFAASFCLVVEKKRSIAC